MPGSRSLLFVAAALLAPYACGGGGSSTGTSGEGGAGSSSGSASSGSGGGSSSSGSASGGSGGGSGGGGSSSGSPLGDAGAPGNPGGHCTVPAAGQAEDVSTPTTVVGTGSAASCTAAAVTSAIHAGGVVTFNCGPAPLTIVVPEIDIYNDGGAAKTGSVTLDGGGKITLSANGVGRILYQNTCDQNLHWTTSHCQDQTTPNLVVQNIGFTAGHGDVDKTLGLLGGGAIYAGGGTFKAVNVWVTDSTQPTLGQDNAGGAIYTFNQTAPVYIVGSTFSGNVGSNGGALGSIGTSWTVLNSLFSNNKADGNGENPAKPGTPGGGLGGAIYNDGDSYTLTVCGTEMLNNMAPDLGSGSIFQVVDDLKGKLVVTNSTFTGNGNAGAVQGSAHPSIYVQAGDVGGTAGVTIAGTTFQ